jgi:tetratricopeptide (TPR) repeat protein
VGDACVYVSGALSLLDRETEALEQLDRALAAYRATTGDRSYRAAIVYANIAAIRVALDDATVADEFFQQAIERMREVLGDDHVAVFLQRGNRLTALLELARLDEAEAEARIVIDTLAQRLGPDHPSASYAHEALAEVHARRGRHEASIATLERALELRSGRGELEQAHTEVLLAQAWRRSGRSGERADTLEAEARAKLEAGGPTGMQRLRALERASSRIERASR